MNFPSPVLSPVAASVAAEAAAHLVKSDAADCGYCSEEDATGSRPCDSAFVSAADEDDDFDGWLSPDQSWLEAVGLQHRAADFAAFGAERQAARAARLAPGVHAEPTIRLVGQA